MKIRLGSGLADAALLAARKEMVGNYLKGTASDWYEESKVTITSWYGNDANSFETRFKNAMITDIRKEKWNQELENIRQSGTIEDYERKFKELLGKADSGNTYVENKKVNLFIRGLEDEIRKAVRLSFPADLNTEISRAK